MPSGSTVFIVDDDATLRKSIRWLVESVGLTVKAYPSAEAFLAEFDASMPGCLVLDVRLGGLSGLDLQQELSQRGSRLPIIVISGFAEVPTAVRALKAGAFDFIEKPFSEQQLLDRIREAIETDRKGRDDEALRKEVEARVALLTRREREVMDMVVAGKASKVIASDLGLSPKTVEVHRARVMSKMQAGSIAELVRLAVLAHPEKVVNSA